MTVSNKFELKAVVYVAEGEEVFETTEAVIGHGF